MLPQASTDGSGSRAMTTRWGVAGTGGMAAAFLADFVHAPTHEVVAIGSRNRERAQGFAEHWGAAAMTYAELVTADLDVLYVATPHPQHRDLALAAIRNGTPVLVEKSFTATLDGAREVVAAARDAGVFCMEAMWTLFLPKFDVVRQVLDTGVLGRIVAAHADMGERFDEPHRILRPDLAGGPLLDLGTYAATFATWTLGAPTEVTALATPAPNGINGQLAIALSTQSGATASLHTTILADTATRASVIGTQGRIDLETRFYLPGPMTLHQRGGPSLSWAEPMVEHDALHFEAAEVARRVAAGQTGSPLRPWADTVQTMQVMDRVRGATGLDFEQARADRETAV